MRDHNGIWIAWGSGNADFTVCDSNNEVVVPEEDPQYALKRIPLSDKIISNYYRGFSNRVLWPLSHLFIEKMHPKKEYWEAYKKANEKFAQAVLETAESDDFIWVHDYHLALVPYLIKQKKPDAKIAFFWHIPWPPWEVFGSLPQRNKILQGLLSSDLIGFHIGPYVNNFMNSASRLDNVKVNRKKKRIETTENTTWVGAFPLGIQYEEYASEAHSKHIAEKSKQLRKKHDAEYLILGIDRLDYTKGILYRLEAFSAFLEKYPEFRGNVVLIQIATPSRFEIAEYASIKEEIDETVGRINGEFSTEKWVPVVYFFRRIPQDLLLAYYRAADIGLLTPLRDGMNLIAKEFIASNDKDGVLILSEFTGAAEKLNEAIIGNPYNIDETADAIKKALEMPYKEKKQRSQALKEKVKKYDSAWWLNKFIDEWEKRYA